MSNPNDKLPTHLQKRMEELDKAAQEASDLVDVAPAAQPEAETPARPQVVYGVTILMMSNGRPHVEMTGKPSYTQSIMLLEAALANLHAGCTAEMVLEMIAKKRIEPL